MNYILFDGNTRNQFLPFTYTRPVAELRIGILTIREKWEKWLDTTTSTVTEDYLSEKWPLVELEENIMINASFLPTSALVSQLESLKEGEAIFHQDEVVAFYIREDQEVDFDKCRIIALEGEGVQVQHPWDLFGMNEAAIKADFD